ncbi:MAG TPA: ATP-binding protein [Gemmatimonadaceae bacterium]|nr:ATP-binding protein [Gemmatimonadaceae bacterium]
MPIRRAKRFSRVSAGIAVAAGVVALTGWATGMPLLKDGLIGGGQMKPWSAVCFILLGIALFLLVDEDMSSDELGSSQHRVARILAAFVVVVASMMFVEYVAELDFGIDRLLFGNTVAADASANGGRMSGASAVCFVFYGFALTLTDVRMGRTHPSSVFAFFAGLIGLIAVEGYLYGAQALYSFGMYAAMPFNTAAVLVLLAGGLLAARPHHGFMQTVTSSASGGLMARRILPFTIILPILAGWLRLKGEHAGLYTTELGTALFAATNVTLIGFIVWLTAYRVNALDVQRAEALDALGRGHAQLAAVIESMQDGVAVCDMNGKFFLVNEAQARINGFPDTDAMKRDIAYFASVYELRRPDGSLVPVFEWPVNRVLRGESISDWELRGRRLDTGREWWFSFSGTPIRNKEQQQVLGVVITRDITTRKEAEDSVKTLNAELERRVEERTHDLQTVNNELEAFSYSVSHDLRAPLRAIHGFAGILLEDYLPTLDPEAQKYLLALRDNASRMDDLINDLLDFSRTGRVDLTFTTVDMNSVVRDVLNELQQDKPLAAEIDVANLPRARGDRPLVRQVWLNLLSNAIKYSRTQPHPRIEVGAQVGRDGADTVYYVRDNGVGFDMRHADKLFGVFQRLHGRDFEGTGVGLAIVQRVVQRHGGRVWAESSPDMGATFYFTLPGRLARSRTPVSV